MIEVLKQMYQLLLTEPHAPAVCDQLEIILRQAINESLAQPAQTSAERTLQHLGYTNNGGEFWKPPLGKQPSPQRTWVGLTDEGIDAAWVTVAWHSSKGLQELRREYAHAIEAELKEKNT
jgi:hypothetical protein